MTLAAWGRCLGVLLLFAVALPVVLPPRAAMAAGQAQVALKKVTLQLKWAHQFQFAGYYAAKEKGFYRARGLDVDIIAAEPGSKPLRLVPEGKATFGVGTTDLLMMRAKGDPVVVLAVIYQHSPLALMVDYTSKYHNIHQLARGRIMVAPDETELFAYFAAEGLKLDNMHFVEHTFDIQSLAKGEVDAMSMYATDERFEYELKVGPARLFRPIDSGVDFYGDNLFTAQKVIDEDPKMVKAFVEASLEGWRYAMTNQEEIVDLILEKYSKRKTRENLLYEARQSADLILADVVPVGYINPARWERIAQHYAGLGMLPKEMNLEGFLWLPDARHLPGWAGRLLIAAGIISVIAIAAGLWLAAFNRKLRHEMDERLRAQDALALRTGELEESNSQKDVMLAVIGHDIRNLFNPLLIYAQLLADPNRRLEMETVRSYGEKLYEAGRHASEVLENLLEWALVRTGQRRASLEVLDLGDLARDASSVYGADASLRGVALDILDAPRLKVSVDRHMIATVIRNLVNNALKFTPKDGKVTVAVERAGDRARVRVSDTGIGMDPDLIARVQSGQNADLATGSRGEIGTGVGLALCRQLVSVNGGRLEIDSKANEGTTCLVSFPLVREGAD